MRFKRIEILNYRQYQKFTFEFPKTTNYDLHVIIASNGVGKTNLLNAINWCIYGDEPHLSGGEKAKKEDTLPRCNTKAMEEKKIAGEEQCDIIVKILAEHEEQQYVFLRKAVFNVNTEFQCGKDDFTVTVFQVNGESNVLHDQEADEVVDHFLPRKIRQYFYFDGEQLLYYFNPETDKVNRIKDSIYEIAGVNRLQTIEDHLGEVKKEIDRQMGKLNPELDKKQNAYDDVIDRIEKIQDEKRKLLLENETAESKIHELDSNYIIGSETIIEKNKRFNHNHDEITRLEAQKKKATDKRADFVKKYIRLLLLYRTNKNTIDYILAREKSDSVSADVNVNAIRESLRKHTCQLCHQHIPDDIEKQLTIVVSKLESNASLQTLSEIKMDVQRSLSIEDYEKDKRAVFDEINDIDERLRTLQEENDRLHQELANVTDITSVQNAMDQKVSLQEAIQSNAYKIGQDDQMLTNLEREKKGKKEELDKAIANDEKVHNLSMQDKFAESAQTIIHETKQEIVNEVKEQMQAITMDIFTQLIWKKNTYDHIELNDDFQVKLYDTHGRSCLSSCSASEKELLALAFTVALHRVSGYDNLLFIDTPVGRVSDENRTNFAEVLLDLSKNKQLILAFTPAEYSEDIRAVFRRDLISSYTSLETTEDESATIKRRPAMKSQA